MKYLHSESYSTGTGTVSQFKVHPRGAPSLYRYSTRNDVRKIWRIYGIFTTGTNIQFYFSQTTRCRSGYRYQYCVAFASITGIPAQYSTGDATVSMYSSLKYCTVLVPVDKKNWNCIEQLCCNSYYVCTVQLCSFPKVPTSTLRLLPAAGYSCSAHVYIQKLVNIGMIYCSSRRCLRTRLRIWRR